MASTRHVILVTLYSLSVIFSITSAAVTAEMQSLIDEEHRKCESGTDTMACIKVRAMRFLDTVMSKDNFKFSDVEVQANGAQTPRTARSHSTETDADIFDTIENYIQGHDITVNLPVVDAKVTVSSRNLVNDELKLNVKLSRDIDVVEGKGKKGNIFKKGKKKRLRKMLMPIMVLILLKAITIIPMAIGILKIKALNALALGFFSFIVSVGLAIFHLCKKIAAEHHSTHHVTAHGPWDGRALVNANSEAVYQPLQNAQNLAYNAYV